VEFFLMQAKQVDELQSEDMIDEYVINDVGNRELVASMLDELKSMLELSRDSSKPDLTE